MATRTPPPVVTVDDVLAELAELEDPKTRVINERRGNDIGVKLSALRAIAKRLKTQHDFAAQLWDTDNTQARLVAILISSPKKYSGDDLEAMLRQATVPKVHDWLVSYLVKKNPVADQYRQRWMADSNQLVAGAGWDLTTRAVIHHPSELDLDALLNVIAAQLQQAPETLQWAMNECLATIGIHHSAQRDRAIAIGERLEVLKDYPTPPNCTSPYVPLWINEMLTRQQAAE